MRVGLLHLGQSVDFVVSITFLRSPVFAIFAICWVFLLRGCLCTHPPGRTASTARSGAASHRDSIAWKERDSLDSVYMIAAAQAQLGWVVVAGGGGVFAGAVEDSVAGAGSGATGTASGFAPGW